MINLFVDSNIWLSIFHYSSDGVEQLKVLKDLVDSEEIKLFLPEQVYEEVTRNRENKLKETLEKFKEFDFKFPAFVKTYPEYEEFNSKYKELKGLHDKWLLHIKSDISNQNTPADEAINNFFNSIPLIPCRKDLIERAKLRMDSGNPPGKNNSYGDAINWECLLDSVPDEENLYVISNDKDYRSVLDEKKIDYYLEQEWETKKNANVLYYQSIANFIKDNFGSIELVTERKKNNLIIELEESRCFATTHRIIRELSEYSTWSPEQIDKLAFIACTNRQVGWILGDLDIYAFFSKIIDSNSSAIISENVKNLKESLKLVSPDDN